MKQGWLLLAVGMLLGSDARAGWLSKRVSKPSSFRSVSVTGGGDLEDPTVLLRVVSVGHPQDATGTPKVQWIAGCHGDRTEARNRVLEHAGLLAEPEYTVDAFAPGVMGLQTDDPAACVVDEQSRGVLGFAESIMDYESYLFGTVFACGCGDCFDPETSARLDETEVQTRATAQHRAEYEAYLAARTEEVGLQRAVHEAYATHYAAWQKQRADRLTERAVRVLFTATEDMPAGHMAVYQYVWSEHQWCGEPIDAGRSDLTEWRFEHPALKEGQTLEVWVEGVDGGMSWGAVLARDKETLDRDMGAIDQESMRVLDQNGPNVDALSPSMEGRWGETGPAVGMEAVNECCSC